MEPFLCHFEKKNPLILKTMADIKLPRTVKLYKQPLQLLGRKKLVRPPSARGGWGWGEGFGRKFLRLAVST